MSIRLPSPGASQRKARRSLLLRRAQGARPRAAQGASPWLDMASPLPFPQEPEGSAQNSLPAQAQPESARPAQDMPTRLPVGAPRQHAGLRDGEAWQEAPRHAGLPGRELAGDDSAEAVPEAVDQAFLMQPVREAASPGSLDLLAQDLSLRDEDAREGLPAWEDGQEDGQDDWKDDFARSADWLDEDLDEELDEELGNVEFEAQASAFGGRVWIAGDDGDLGLLGPKLSAASAESKLRDFLQALHDRNGCLSLPERGMVLQLLRGLGGKTRQTEKKALAAMAELSMAQLERDCFEFACRLLDFQTMARRKHPQRERVAKIMHVLEEQLPKLKKHAGQGRIQDCVPWLAGEAPATPSGRTAIQPGRQGPRPRVFNLDLDPVPASGKPAGEQPRSLLKALGEGLAPDRCRDLGLVPPEDAGQGPGEDGGPPAGAMAAGMAGRPHMPEGVPGGPNSGSDHAQGAGPDGQAPSPEAGGAAGTAGTTAAGRELDVPVAQLKDLLQRLGDSHVLCGMPGRRNASRVLRLLGGTPPPSSAGAEGGWDALDARKQEACARSLCEALQRVVDAVSRDHVQMPGLRLARALLKVLLDALPGLKQRAKRLAGGRSPASSTASSAASPAASPRSPAPAGAVPAVDASRQEAELRSLDLGRLGELGGDPAGEERAEALLACAVGVLAQAFSQDGALPLAAAQAARAAEAARVLLDRALGSGMASQHARRCWQLVLQAPAWFRKEAEALARLRFAGEAERLCAAKGRAFAARRLKESSAVFGCVLEGLGTDDDPPGPPAPLPDLPQHTLWTREPQAEWDVYIDESGGQFSGEGADAGNEGRVVAVCLRKGTRLPDLGLFHSCDRGLHAVTEHFRALLASGCGLIGFTRTALGADGPDGWLVCICELVKWVWRLLPLLPNGEKTQLRFHVEERMAFAPGLGTDLGRIMLEADLRAENPRRALQMRIASIGFESKRSPMLAWADIAAYVWGRADAGAYPDFAQLNLAGTCLVSGAPGVVRACEALLRQGSPGPGEWTSLMREPARPGSIHALALEWLRRRCLARPSLWEPYRQALQETVEAPDPAMDMLERMAEWLRPMSMPTFASDFFWHTLRLRLLPAASLASRPADASASGAVPAPAAAPASHAVPGSAACADPAYAWYLDLHDAMAAVEGMLLEMARMQPLAALHGALRLAEADCALFRFADAQRRLDAWNPEQGGQLPGSPWQDALVLCQLGRCRGLLRDPAGAGRAFREAAASLRSLARNDGARGESDPGRAAKAEALARKVRFWRAMACMDDAGVEPVLLAEAMEQALGMPLAEASRHWGAKPLEDAADAHLLLVRCLVLAGCETDRRSYRRFAWLWSRPGVGMGQGPAWVRIQYYRWLLAGEDDWALRQELAASLAFAMGEERSPGEELAACAVLQSLAPARAASAAEQSLLDQAWGRLQTCLPGAADLVRALQKARPGDPLLARRTLPFDLC